MRELLRSTLVVAVGVAICVVLVGIASTHALSRSARGWLGISLAAAIRADYSVDPAGIKLAPLDPQLIDQARRDESTLPDPDRGSPTTGAAPRTATPTITPRPGATLT